MTPPATRLDLLHDAERLAANLSDVLRERGFRWTSHQVYWALRDPPAPKALPPAVWADARSWLAHGAIAAAITLAGAIGGFTTEAAAAAIGFYVGREIAQHELTGTPAGRRLDRALDAIVPAAVAVALALAL